MKKNYTVTESICRDDGVLKLSSLFLMFQDIAADHVEVLGCSEEFIHGNGMLWVVSNQAAEIVRLPEAGEEIVIETWAEKTKMMFFPRRYRVTDASGAVIIEAGAMWALIDIVNRKVVSPKERGIIISDYSEEDSEIMHLKPHAIPATEEDTFTIPHSFIDSNGHMNNTRYFDIADVVLAETIGNSTPKKVIARYSKESFENDVLTIRWGVEDSCYYLTAESEHGNHIKMEIAY